MKKIIKLSSIAVIALCLSVCSRNVEEDIKQCSNAVDSVNKLQVDSQSQMMAGKGVTEIAQLELVKKQSKIAADNADACLSAYENTTEGKDESTKQMYISLAYMGLLHKGDVNQLKKACKILHEAQLSKVSPQANPLASDMNKLVCSEPMLKMQIQLWKEIETGEINPSQFQQFLPN